MTGSTMTMVAGASKPMPTVEDDLRVAISEFEGGFQNYAWDPGNYVDLPGGGRALIGTMKGVTPNTLAAHLGVKPHEITVARIQAVTLEEAVEIGRKHFYDGTGLDLVPWGPATAVLVDFAWGSGPAAAVRMAQRLCGKIYTSTGATTDGQMGPLTISAYHIKINEAGWALACDQLHDLRIEFYKALGRQDPVRFGPPQPGWKRRADFFRPIDPGSGSKWWSLWRNSTMPLPVKPDQMPARKPPQAAAPTPKGEPAGLSPAELATAGAGVVGAATKPVLDIVREPSVTDIVRDGVPQLQQVAGYSGWIAYAIGGLVLVGIGVGLYRIWRKRRDRAILGT